MSSTRSFDGQRLRRQLATLQQRVSAIERALTPRGNRSKRALPKAELDRNQAAHKARHEAMQEYFKQREIDRYRESPYLLKLARDQERSINAFLRDRGIRPAKSDLPRIVKLLAEESKSKTAESASGKRRATANSAYENTR